MLFLFINSFYNIKTPINNFKCENKLEKYTVNIFKRKYNLIRKLNNIQIKYYNKIKQISKLLFIIIYIFNKTIYLYNQHLYKYNLIIYYKVLTNHKHNLKKHNEIYYDD